MKNDVLTIFNYDVNLYALVIGLIFILLLIGIWRANRANDIEFDCIDLITSVDQTTGKNVASMTKILQLVGAISGTFIVIKLTLQNSLTWDIFATYLTYVASTDGFSKFMLAKYGVLNQPKPPEN